MSTQYQARYAAVGDEPHQITRESRASIWAQPVAIRRGKNGIEQLETYGTEKCFDRETRRERRSSSPRRADLGRLMTGVEVLNHLKEQQRKRRAEADAHKAEVEALAAELEGLWRRLINDEQFEITASGPEYELFRLKAPGQHYRRPGVWEVFAVVQPSGVNTGYDIEAAGVFSGKDDEGKPAYSTTRFTVRLTDLEHGALFTRQMALARLVKALQE